MNDSTKIWKLYEAANTAGVEYEVNPNENLDTISQSLGVDPQEILKLNPQLSQNGAKFTPGMKINIPQQAVASVDAPAVANPAQLPGSKPATPAADSRTPQERQQRFQRNQELMRQMQQNDANKRGYDFGQQIKNAASEVASDVAAPFKVIGNAAKGMVGAQAPSQTIAPPASKPTATTPAAPATKSIAAPVASSNNSDTLASKVDTINQPLTLNSKPPQSTVAPSTNNTRSTTNTPAANNNLSSDFKKFHGSDFNPSSRVDREKMQHMQALQKQGTPLTASSVYKPMPAAPTTANPPGTMVSRGLEKVGQGLGTGLRSVAGAAAAPFKGLYKGLTGQQSTAPTQPAASSAQPAQPAPTTPTFKSPQSTNNASYKPLFSKGGLFNR